MFSFRFNFYAFTVFSCLTSPALCNSEDAHAALELEEILVTAQRKLERLQDVPISVNTLSGDKIVDTNITGIRDLQGFVPNFSQLESAIGTSIFIRGFGSNINPGFEQSVGIYRNGVSHSRARLSRAPFLDLERVEVLRGPQNVLYGRNSIAGAVNLVSAKPSEEFEGSLGLTYEPRFNDRIGDLILSGPLTNTLSARLAHRSRRFDGFVDNLDGGDEPERDEHTTRLSLLWQANAQFNASLIYEHSDFDARGRQLEVIIDSPSLNPALGGLNYSQSLLAINPLNALTGAAQTPESVLNTDIDFARSGNGDFSNNSSDTAILELNYLADNVTVTATSALVAYDFSDSCDCDFTSANIFLFDSTEDYEQFSQEIRIESDKGGAFDWTAGLYYQNTTLDTTDALLIPPDSILGNLLDAALPSLFMNLTGLDIFPAGGAQQINNLNVPRAFSQDSELLSAFAQFTWHVSERSRLVLGARASYEKKDARRSVDFTDPNGTPLPFNDAFIPNQSIGIDFLFGQVLQAVRHNLEGERDEAQIAPSIQFEHDINAASFFYASWARGFKAGGFDVRSNAPPEATVFTSGVPGGANPGAFEFEEERADTFELGLKTRFNGGKTELNLALFHTRFDDLQVSNFDGSLSFNVGNAAKATSQGLELDGRWALSQNWRLNGSLALLDFEFDRFPTGQCSQLMRISTGQSLCDFSGRSNQSVADVNAALSLQYLSAINEALAFDAALDVIYSSDYNPSPNTDPDVEQSGFAKLNLRLSLAGTNDTWELSLLGRNLTDETVVSFAGDTPLAATLTQSVSFYGILEPPRTVAIQASYRF